MRKWIAAAVLAPVLAIGTGLTVHASQYQPCATEDSPGPCYWHAQTRGNGQGQSFIVTSGQRVIYLP